ncbi:WGxxGxxG-CTERM domain-containing protein [Deinococcus maricopensis]|uniref:MYXO-CTERM domain-containing protein n=1 Tax=Deinococcus maricopensis (strain DSM 21211 / LMG 22137 / NRRL B-23946 / LB-34) TaxID=709986 RepID=E8U6F0_DEIML|nr:WGxxGxxG-CTERM domain-containing protein [Deinococcus maricopensis]ADV66639.1 hypothetical protein Deima_0986 [Deinococcus maricopensis DSM 21211]
MHKLMMLTLTLTFATPALATMSSPSSLVRVQDTSDQGTSVGDAAQDAATSTGNAVENAGNAVNDAVDPNGDGVVDSNNNGRADTREFPWGLLGLLGLLGLAGRRRHETVVTTTRNDVR